MIGNHRDEPFETMVFSSSCANRTAPDPHSALDYYVATVSVPVAVHRSKILAPRFTKSGKVHVEINTKSGAVFLTTVRIYDATL